MKKSIGFGLSLFGCLSFAIIIASQTHPLKTVFSRASVPEQTLTLDSNNIPGGLTSSYQNSFDSTVTTTYGNTVNLTFVNAKSDSGKFAVLANHGRIHNFNDNNQQITGINGVSFTGSGSFVFKPAVTKGILPDITPIAVTAGGGKVAIPSCDYFEIEAGDSGATITSLSLSYSCNAGAYDVKLANGTYTGIGADSYTYKLEINNGSAILSSLNKTTNTTINGTASLSSKTALQLSFTNLTVNLTYNGHSLTFLNRSGSNATNWPNISLDRVYTLENFESYSASGQGYTNSTTKYQTTGLRASFYADYYTGSSSGEIGGSGWPIMTSTDNTTFTNSKGHNSSKGGVFKFSNGSSMRYISMNSLYGIKRIYGKGSTLSVWLRGAYTNTSLNTDHGSGTTMKFYAYYATPLSSSNQASARETFDFNLNAGSTWQHFEFQLTPSRDYYGFGFFAQQSSGSTQYIPVDDIQIYTASPYAEPIVITPVTGVSISLTSLSMSVGSVSKLKSTITPNNASNKVVSWSSSNSSIVSVDSEGNLQANATGTANVTVTTDDGHYTATCLVTVNSLQSKYPEGTYKGSATVSYMTVSFDASVVFAYGTQMNGLFTIRVGNQDPVITSYNYDASTKNMTFTTSGSIVYEQYNLSATIGTITCKYNSTNNRIENVKFTGGVKDYLSNNGSITSTKPSSEYYECDGSTATLQSTFKRRYRSNNSWNVDTTNTNRFVSNTTNYVCGTGAMSVKPCGTSYQAYAFSFSSDYASAKSLQNLGFWVYNPGNDNVYLREWIYTKQNFDGNEEMGKLVAYANGWTYCAMGFGKKNIYNFQIAVWTSNDPANTAAAMETTLSFDNIYLFY